MESASEFLVGYGAVKWSDANHHDVQFEAEQIATALSTKLKQLFAEWIISLRIPSSLKANNCLTLPRNANYLNFNYTPTLEVLYSVSRKKILYITVEQDAIKNLFWVMDGLLKLLKR